MAVKQAINEQRKVAAIAVQKAPKEKHNETATQEL